MKPRLVPLLMLFLAAGLAVAGCSQAAPTPPPTSAPVPPTKAAVEPTKPAAQPTQAPAKPTAQPTQGPAKTVDFPVKGKSITMIVPWPAGGTGDVGARLVAAQWEKDLGVPVQVINKPGAGTEMGVREVVTSKPDGYTLGWIGLPSTPTVYLDPDRQATISRKDLLPVANHVMDPEAIAVRSESPFKTLKDLVDAAKANPGGLKAATAGLLSDNHLAQTLFGQLAGIRLTFVHFDGGAPATTALIGGHVDIGISTAGNYPAHYKSGAVRILGIMSKERSKFYPNVPTFEEQGYKITYASSRGMIAPAGTPPEVVSQLSRALKKVIDDAEHKKKLDELALPLNYLDPVQYAAFWDEFETQMKPLIGLAKKQQ